MITVKNNQDKQRFQELPRNEDFVVVIVNNSKIFLEERRIPCPDDTEELVSCKLF